MLTTGKSGLLAAQKQLSTVSNNISNVSTDGYVRQETIYYTSVIDWGVGSSYTRRMYNVYTQRELFRDLGSVGYYETYLAGMETTDYMLSEDSLSVSTALNTVYESLQDAIQNPTSTAYRQELLANLEDLVYRFNNLNAEIQQQLIDINNEIQDTVDTINTLVTSIYNIMGQISSISASASEDIYLQLLDERDRLITELASLVDIQCYTEEDDDIAIYLGNGQLLCDKSTYATLTAEQDEYDSSVLNIRLTFNDRNSTSFLYYYDDFSGELGGYMAAAHEIRQTQRDLGQLAVAIADALNECNNAGLTLENIAGSDLLSYDTTLLGVSDNDAYYVTCDFVSGMGSNVLADDYKIIIGATGEMYVYLVSDGTDIELTEGTDYTVEVTDDGTTVIDLSEYGGITLTLSDTIENIANSRASSTTFYVQPTVNQAYVLSVAATKVEDFAFAACVRTNTGSNNYGNAVISLESVTGTGDDHSVGVDEDSGEFVFNENAANYIKIDADGNYLIYYATYDDDGNLADLVYLGYADASTNGQNIFSQAIWDGGVVAEDYDPGYDVSITGTVSEDDYFYIEINDEGYSDNTNGLYMGQLFDEELVAGSSSSNKQTFTDDYAELTAKLGSAVLSATNNLEAAEAKLEQTQELFDSVAGVNLDEEAVNLVKYQQIYSACSKIITASQDCFDALISAIR